MAYRILALAESADDDFMRIHAYLLLGTSIGFSTAIAPGLEILEKGIAIFDPERQRLQPFQIGNNPGIVCYTASATFLWWLGLADRSAIYAEKAVELARQLEHPYTMAYAYFHTGLLASWSGHFQRARSHALAMGEIAAEHEYHLWEALSRVLLGAAESGLGQIDQGLSRLEEGFAAYMGHITPPVFWPDITAVRAEVYGRAGRQSEGIDMLNELLDQGHSWPPLLLLKAHLLLTKAPPETAAAVDALRQTMAASELTGAKILALKAAIMLARIELEQGQMGESARLLADLYSSFSEGFGTADLQAARELLLELESSRHLTDSS